MSEGQRKNKGEKSSCVTTKKGKKVCLKEEINSGE